MFSISTDREVVRRALIINAPSTIWRDTLAWTFRRSSFTSILIPLKDVSMSNRILGSPSFPEMSFNRCRVFTAPPLKLSDLTPLRVYPGLNRNRKLPGGIEPLLSVAAYPLQSFRAAMMYKGTGNKETYPYYQYLWIFAHANPYASTRSLRGRPAGRLAGTITFRLLPSFSGLGKRNVI